MCACVYELALMSLHMLARMSACICIWAKKYCKHGHLCVCLCARAYASVYVYVCACMQAFVCVHVCVCLRIPVCDEAF